MDTIYPPSTLRSQRQNIVNTFAANTTDRQRIPHRRHRCRLQKHTKCVVTMATYIAQCKSNNNSKGIPNEHPTKIESIHRQIRPPQTQARKASSAENSGAQTGGSGDLRDSIKSIILVQKVIQQ